MLKYLPEQPLVRSALGAVAVLGAGSIAYFLVFPPSQPQTEPSAPPETAALAEPTTPTDIASRAERSAPADTPALTVPETPADTAGLTDPSAPAVPDAQTALPTPSPSALTDDPGAGGLPPEDTAPEIQTAMAAPLADMAPSFDLVRITDLGDVLIAGRAPASSTVAALIDEDPVAQAVSSRAGEFVMMFALAPHPAPRVLELEVRLPSGDRVRSADTLMLAPRSPALPDGGAQDAVAAAEGFAQPRQMVRAVEIAPPFPDSTAPARPGITPDPAEGVAPDTQASAGAPDSAPPERPDAPQAPAVDIARAQAPSQDSAGLTDPAQGSASLPDSASPARPGIIPDPARDIARAPDPAQGDTRPPDPGADAPDTRVETAPMAMLLRADGGVQLLGPAPGVPGAQTSANVTIDSVVYDAEGEIAISGRSQDGGADIQIYLDNQPILRARASADGNWQAQLAGIERGVYRLRVDELDAAAQVVSRAEIPFERVTPEIARTASGPQALIVQPGNTLWGMSEQQFGEGWRYMRIFDANRDQIRNPDLIFPGQVFILPEAAE